MAGEMAWLQKKKLQGLVAWDYLEPFRKAAGITFLPVTWPMRKAYELGYLGLSKVTESAQWTRHAVTEALAGTFQTTVSPFMQLAKSRLITAKRFLWDVPIASFSAAIRTPIALATSPINMVRGVRDAIMSVPGNAREILSDVMNFRFMDAMKSTRKAVTDVLVPPFKRPIEPILRPGLEVIGKGVAAEFQTATTLGTAVTQTIPEGARRVWNAPGTASAIMAQIKAKRELNKAVLQQEKEEADKELEAMIRSEKGLPANDKGKKKKAA